MVLLKTEGGVKALPLNRITEVIFIGPHRTTVKTEESVSRLTLNLDWGAGRPKETAAVGMVYLQKGLRWIPEYKVVLDGKGRALVRLQATLINELVDLEGSGVHLVVGVPSISFKDTIDPMALRKTVAELSQYFREDSQTRFALSNAIMTQSARMGEHRQGGREAPPAEGEAEVSQVAKDEDLFIFDLKDITLRKGERMVVPVAEYPIEYREVFTLDLPFSPPRELRANPGSEQERSLARLLSSPRVLRKVRLQNRSRYPITTAPALVFAGETLLGQGMTTYAAINGSCDLPLTTAVDVQVQRTDRETGRKSEELLWQNSKMLRIDLKGGIALTNRLGRAVDLEVTRQVLGVADEAAQGGTAEQVNSLEDDSWLGSGAYPAWWGWYNWPTWWARFNGVGRFQWTVHLEPGKRIDLPYAWHYYWI
jgi:hypothetical protein